MDYTKRIFGKSAGLFIIQFLILSILVLSASGQDWSLRKSHHFLVYYKSAENSFLNQLIKKAESCYRKITEEFGFFRDEPWVWRSRAKIYVYDNKEEYLANTLMPDWSGGCAQPAEKKVYTYTDSYQFIDNTIIHELTHLIFAEFAGKKRVPLWLDEGIAVYMEKKSEWYSLKDQISSILKRSEQIPFEEVLEADFQNLDSERDPTEALTPDSYVKKFYLQSWSMVFFLIKKYGRDEFRQLVRNIEQGRNIEDALLRTYRSIKSMQDFKREWKKYYR